MDVYLIKSDAAAPCEGFPAGMRTIITSRRTPETVARYETTDAEKATRVSVEQRTGRGKGTFWSGIPSEFWPR